MPLAEETKEIEELKEDAFRFETKLNSVQKELYKAQKKKINTLENQALRKILDDKNRECEKLLAMIEELKITESEISNKLNAEQKKVEELTNELMESRKKQVNVDKLNKSIQLENDKLAVDCKMCEEYSMKVGNLELYQLQLQNSNGGYLIKINKEIEKLQEEAKEFESFMRSKSNRKGSTSSKDSSTNTSQTISNSTEESDSKEINISEMARIFANQIRAIENKSIEDIKKLQNEIVALSNELENKSAYLETSTEQLQLLKLTMVHERQNFEATLNEKEEIYKQNIEKYQKRVEDLNSQIDMINDERKAIENCKLQIEDEQKLLIKREEDALQKLEKLQQDSTKIIEELTEKYKEIEGKYEEANKTTELYKRYSDEKENHYRSEYERVKREYAEEFERIQSVVNEKQKQYNENLKKMEQEYESKIDDLKRKLEKSQKRCKK